MKKSSLLLFASLLLAISAFSGAASAQLSSYAIDADLSKQGVANVKLVMTFAEPTDRFELILPVRITSFNATSSTGPVVCNNRLDGVSLISCDLNLTKDRKTLEITFQSSDMIKTAQAGYVFTSDFSVKIPAKTVFAAVRLPEGMVLSENVPGGATIPFSNSTATDGRRITVIWRFSDVNQRPISFQVFYEPGIEPAPAFGVPPLRVLILLAIIFGGGIGLILLRRYRKTQQVIFSVLDDYEKRVISSIEKGGGVVNQKKIVIDTNLSKAKVSRVVQKLVERGLLEVERRGRTNIVKFIKKKLAF